jgi:serine/threonine-protein kinase HipA
MKVGSHYRWHDISLRDWLRLGKDLGFPEDRTRIILRLVGRNIADAAATEAGAMKSTGIDHPVVDRLVDAISESADRCLGMLDH